MNGGASAILDASPTMPLVVGVDELVMTQSDWAALQRRYYFWFFGYVAKLPYEREIEREGSVQLPPATL